MQEGTRVERAGVRPSGQRPELIQRVISALVLAPFAIGAVMLGGWPFGVFWGVAAAIVAVEWIRLIGADLRSQAAAVVTMLAVLICALTGSLITALGALAAGLGSLSLLAGPGTRLWAIAGLAYAGVLLLACIALRSDPDHGLAAILFLFAVVWSTDIAGYFAGRAIGGPKLWARVSPKKTWAGAIGGSAGAMVAGLACAAAFVPLRLLSVAAVALVLSMASQAGDLAESALKRRFGVKDASQLIPGHGGLMDRLDGFVTASFVAVLIGLFRAGPHNAGRGLLVW